MQRFYFTIGTLALLTLFVSGCGSLTSKLAEPEWSSNYAIDGKCSIPELADGSMYTTAKTNPAEYVKGEKQDESRFHEIDITLKEPKSIGKIVVRRRQEDVVAVDVDLQVMSGGNWETIKEIRGEIKTDIEARVNVKTDKIKVKIQRATRTADGKSALSASRTSGGARGGRRGMEVDRILHDPIALAEIELYGYKTQEPGK